MPDVAPCQLSVTRQDTVVQLTLVFRDAYMAVVTHDDMLASIHDHRQLRLHLHVGPGAPQPPSPAPSPAPSPTPDEGEPG